MRWMNRTRASTAVSVVWKGKARSPARIRASVRDQLDRPTPRAVLRHDPATIRCKIQCRSCRDCDTMAAAVENGLTLALQVYRGESESDTARVEWTTAVCSGEQYSHWYRLPLCPWDEAGSGSHRSAIH